MRCAAAALLPTCAVAPNFAVPSRRDPPPPLPRPLAPARGRRRCPRPRGGLRRRCATFAGGDEQAVEARAPGGVCARAAARLRGGGRQQPHLPEAHRADRGLRVDRGPGGALLPPSQRHREHRQRASCQAALHDHHAAHAAGPADFARAGHGVLQLASRRQRVLAIPRCTAARPRCAHRNALARSAGMIALLNAIMS